MALSSLLIIYLFQPCLRARASRQTLPDLIIRQYEFVSTNDKGLRVQIANDGRPRPHRAAWSGYS